MADLGFLLSLTGSALGALGGALVFIELFQTPSYISYQTEWDDWNVDLTPTEVDEYSWAGRVGALLIALAFALQFLSTLLGQAA